VDFTESTEHTMLRAAVGDLAGSFGHEYFVGKSRAGEPTSELWHALAEHGFLGVNVGEEYEGGGGGVSELAIVCEEVAARGTPQLLILVQAIVTEIIGRFGTDEQKKTWLPGLAAGTFMAFAITEPDAGSNSHNIATTATRDGDVYRLRGSKTFISGVDESETILVVARTGTDESTGRARLSLLIVDSDAPGLERTFIPTEISSPEKQFLLFFDDVDVPADRLLGEEHQGLRHVFVGLNPERIMSASLCAGIGRYALDKAAAYARERRVWDVPIGAHQGLAHPLAIGKVELEQARLMTAKAAWLHDHESGSADSVAAGEAANMAKYAAAEAGLHCLDAAIQTHGGNGMTTEFGLADLWGLARLLRIVPVSREMVLNFVASQSLGLPKSY
jgi:alkylation response protein AidB-like acyl-CoA dehydrogenase